MKKIILLMIFMYSINIFSSENIIENSNIAISIEDAVNLSLKNNLNIDSEELKLKEKKWAMITCWNIFIPDVSVSTEFKKLNEKAKPDLKLIGPIIGDAYGVIPEEDKPDWSLDLKLDITVSVNSEMVFNVYQTVLDWEKGKLSLEKAKNDLTKETKIYFYNLLLLENTINIYEENLKNAEARYNETAVRYHKGIIPKYNLLSAQVSYENIKPYLTNLKNKYSLLIINYKKILGVKQEINLILNDKVFDIEEKEINAELLSGFSLDKNTNIKILNAELQSLINKKNMNISRLTPSFILGYSVDPSFIKDPMKDDWFGSNKYNKTNWKQSNGCFVFGLQMPLDVLFPFSKTQMEIVNAQYEIEQKNLEINDMKKNVELEIKSIIINLNKSKDLSEKLKMNFDIALESYNLADSGYKSGNMPFLEIEKSENDLINAKLNILNEKYNYLVCLADLEYAINTKI